MKGFLQSILTMIILAAILVGGFHFYTNRVIEPKDPINKISGEENQINQTRNTAAMLNADEDGDGLTYHEEQQLGTSDKKIDTDEDGVPDSEDIAPTGIGRKVTKLLTWNYKGAHSVEAVLPIDVSDYYEKTMRPKHTFDAPYYAKFIQANDIGIQRLAAELKEIIDNAKGWDYYDEVMFVVSLVQHKRYADSAIAGFDLTTKYPMQTIISGRGDCEDTSILAAALLYQLEYDVKLARLDIDGNVAHLGVAVWGENTTGTSWMKGGKDYYYIETTEASKYGEMPIAWRDGTTATLVDMD